MFNKIKDKFRQLKKTKNSKFSYFSMAFAGILSLGLCASSGICITHLVNRQQQSAEFYKSVNGTITFNPVAFEPDANKSKKDVAMANLKESAKRLSLWMKYSGLSFYDVVYDLGEPIITGSSPTAQYTQAHLTAKFDIDKVNSKELNIDEKIDNDPYLSFFNAKAFNSNNKSLVYRWWTQNPSSTSINNEPKYTILDFSDIFEIPNSINPRNDKSKSLTNKNGKNGVMLQVKDGSHDILNAIYKDLKDAYKQHTSHEEGKEAQPIKSRYQPRLYIVNDLDSFFNETQYHTLNYYYHQNNNETEYLKWYHDSAVQNFAKSTIRKTKWGPKDNPTSDDQTYDKKDTDRVWWYKERLEKSFTSDEAEKKINNGEILEYIDWSNTGSVETSFMQKYIDKIYCLDLSTYTSFFPNIITDVYKNDKIDDQNPIVKYVWYEMNSKDDANRYLSNIVNYGLKGKISAFNFTLDTSKSDNENINNAYNGFVNQHVSKLYNNPKFDNTILENSFGSNSSILSLVIGFAIFLFILLITLTLLYRTIGLISWICMIFTLSITMFVAIANSMMISFSFLFGMLIMSLASFITAVVIGEKIKRKLASNNDVPTSVSKGLISSFSPILDISFICFVFGICLTYIAPISLNPMGVSLIFGGFAIFVVMFLVNSLILLALFFNEIMLQKFVFLGKPSNKAVDALSQKQNFIPATLDATKLQFSFYNNFSFKKFSLINKSSLYINIGLLVILIIGMIIFGIFGISHNNLFSVSHCLVLSNVPNEFDNSQVLNIIQKHGINILSSVNDSQKWFIYTNTNISNDLIVVIKEQFGKNNEIILSVGDIIGNTNKDILLYAIVSLVIASLISSLYICIKSNWISFVPVLITTFLVPLLVLGLGTIINIKFDEIVVLGFALIVIVNTLITCITANLINSTWLRNDAYSKSDFKFIINTNFKNNLFFYGQALMACLLLTIILIIFAPKGLNSLIYFMLIGSCVAPTVSVFVVSYLLYHFFHIRNKLLIYSNSKNTNKQVIDYDEIDEQEIEGINKFTKIKLIPKNN